MTNPFSRRHVLQLGAAGAAAASWPGGLASSQEGESLPLRAIGRPFPSRVNLPSRLIPPPAEDSVGVAIMGLGGYALRQMMPATLEAKRCHVAAVVSGNAEKAARVAAAYGVPDDAIYSYEDFDRVASDDRVDAVYNILPSGLHADWVEKAFAAGKHVICEKPMALTSAECDRMIAAADRADRLLMIGYRCHFEPYNLHAMELMRAGAVGPLKLIRTDHHYVMGANSSPATNWRANRALAGGGALEDYGIYGLQAALYLTNEMPLSVSALVNTPTDDPRFAEIDGHVAAQLHFPSGAIAQLATSYSSRSENRVEVRGVDGTLLMDPATGYGGNSIVLDRRGGSERPEPGSPHVQFAAQMDHFAAAIRDGEAIKTPGDMGLRDVRLMEAIYASAGAGRRLRLHPDGRIVDGQI